MEQAPLVYSSSKQFGIGVKSGAPDAPGLDVHIGFRALDAAYVPVAVAKQCGQGQTCSGITYNVVPINGMNTVSGLSKVDERQIATDRRIIDDGVKAIEQRARQKGVLTAQLAEISDLAKTRSRVTELESVSTATPSRALTPSEESELVQIKAKVARLAALDATAIQAEVDKIDIDNNASAKLVDQARERLGPLLAQRNEQTGDEKSDALSVYGTFNGDSTGNAQGATLKLGNTFSTGIAAQNVTQGLRDSAPIKATQECLAATEVILRSTEIKPDDKVLIVKSITSACGHRPTP
ncbi:hypothetical protein [Sphingomonas sp. HMP6]|uniref:hypothetical protein n=1 Tax=Sphingomonas sp. HMP6 TaxID=1517551 RepID=UPI001596755B|nr:hypothetical protein [Sphingomonas sp. HMP6]BCA57273.1 hypothetical protein HMP06_0042 [Sphingomonas sp. HMP6]